MFNIDRQSRIPIYEQICKKVTELIRKNELKAGDKLPGVRELAKSLGVSQNTVSKAFKILERDKFTYSLAGLGSFVSDVSTDLVRKSAFAYFDKTVKESFESGISRQELIDRIIAGKDN